MILALPSSLIIGLIFFTVGLDMLTRIANVAIHGLIFLCFFREGFSVKSLPRYIQFKRISLTGFLAQSVRSSNAIALDSLYLLVLIIGASQSRQHVDISLIHIESRKPFSKSLFDVDSSRISIVIVNTKEHHSDVLAVSQG
ncbi:hypothetical protein Tco_0271250 [Tanacetum coccineum]